MAVGQTTHGWDRRLTHLLAVIFVIVIAHTSAQLTWMPFQQWQPASLPVSTQGVEFSSGSQQESSALVTWDLFGRPENPDAQEQVLSQVDAPQTQLQLLLEGVFVGEQDEKSGAIVSQKGQPAQFYKFGDSLPGNAELVGVFADRIILRRSGRLETLSFEDTAAALNTLQKVDQPRVSSPEEFVNVAQRQLAENPVSALASVGLRPIEGVDQPSGYVYDGSNPMLRSLNLQPGDVIRSVNGHALGDVQKDRELLQSLYEQGMLEVEVERGGASFFVNYPLRQN